MYSVHIVDRRKQIEYEKGNQHVLHNDNGTEEELGQFLIILQP